MWSFSYLLLLTKRHKLIKVIVSKLSNNPLYGYSILLLMMQEKLVLGARLSAKVLRWKSHHEKCPWQGQNRIFYIFFNR